MRYLAISLSRYLAVSLFRCFAVSLFRCFAVSLFRCFAVSLFRYFAISLFRNETQNHLDNIRAAYRDGLGAVQSVLEDERERVLI